LSSHTSLSNLTQTQPITLTLQHGILPAFTAWCNQPLQYSMIASSESASSRQSNSMKHRTFSLQVLHL
jgi:hypothetical protein